MKKKTIVVDDVLECIMYVVFIVGIIAMCGTAIYCMIASVS